MAIIMHVDMDAFFAAVEERENPLLKGKPVIIGADPKDGFGRGVVSTANYEARKYRVGSALPISIAYKRCPIGVFLRGNFRLYRQVSDSVMAILEKHAGIFQKVSIDEAYLDVSYLKDYAKAKALGEQIKKEILEQEKLTCSVGVGPNKLIAKVSSEFEKPNGLTVVQPGEVLSFLSPQDVGVLRGVGKKTKPVLNDLGIKTVADLRKMPREELRELFGVFGESLFGQARGKYTDELVADWEQKSIGKETTFGTDVDDKELLLETLETLIYEVWERMHVKEFAFRTLSIKIRYDDFETFTRSQSLLEHSSHIEAIRSLALRLLAPFFADSRKIRLIGVSVSNLKENQATTNVLQAYL